MKKLFVIALVASCSSLYAQNSNPLDMLGFGVILDDPKMKDVKVKRTLCHAGLLKYMRQITIATIEHTTIEIIVNCRTHFRRNMLVAAFFSPALLK